MKARVATQPITNRAKVALAGAATGLALLAFTSGSALAAGGAAPESAGAAAQSQGHGQMHGMMNSMHGEGASQKMHEAMGPQAEKMMDKCASGMENMGGMENMQGMMGGGMMNGGMQDGGMQGESEGQYQDAQ
jgi:hypothetical protein